MYRISSHIVGDKRKGKVAPFTFPLPSGGDEIKGAPLFYVPHLVDKVVHFLNEMKGMSEYKYSYFGLQCRQAYLA